MYTYLHLVLDFSLEYPDVAVNAVTWGILSEKSKICLMEGHK